MCNAKISIRFFDDHEVRAVWDNRIKKAILQINKNVILQLKT